MEWTITIKEDDQYAEIVTSGVADRNGSIEMAKGIGIAMSEKKLTRALIDHSNIVSVSGGALNVYQRPKQFRDMGVINWLNIAEIVRPEHANFFGFLETVCVNSGFGFAIFNDRESALEWLLK